ncbi:hypothetical protein KP509_13G004600 [Ceratopteris richardii]|uniref:Cytochrome P450 n=1 Tax=Ceratopteris richardii TaxID=49495 RepID=A0A8T2TAX2_CERRI|nr:hypothetical protein KP509_13G004600 [Ceratopteris richardii]
MQEHQHTFVALNTPYCNRNQLEIDAHANMELGTAFFPPATIPPSAFLQSPTTVSFVHLLPSFSALAASKLLSLAACLILLIMAMWVFLAIIAWSHPGGSAWGLHALQLCSTTSTAPPDACRKGLPPPIPGPRGLPFVGSLLAFIGRLGNCPHRRLSTLASRHASRAVMALSLGSTRIVVSSDPIAARQILCGPAFTERPLTESARQLLFERAIGFCPRGQRWRTLRRLSASHLFCPRRLAAHERRRQTVCSAMLETMIKDLSGSSMSTLRVRPYLQHSALSNIMEMVFGKRFAFSDMHGGGSGEVAELQSMVREGFELLGAFNVTDHMPRIFEAIDPLRIRQRCGALVPRVSAYVQSIIDGHRARRPSPATSSTTQESNVSNDDSDFVDVLLTMQEQEKLSDSDIISILWEMIFRGTDTMAILTEWIIAELALHPDVQEKLYAEIAKTSNELGELRDSDAARMPYLQAVVKEGLRLHPPGPLLSWARLAVHDAEVGGFVVPAGTTAMVNMWAITHDERIWPEPERFRPERFLESQWKAIEPRGNDIRLAPFGAGARACPGRALAMATVSMWVGRIVHRFRVAEHRKHPVCLNEILKLSCEMEVPLVAQFTLR